MVVKLFSLRAYKAYKPLRFYFVLCTVWVISLQL